MEQVAEFHDQEEKAISFEKREWHRRRVLKPAYISFNKGFARYSCTVKNLSGQGAMLLCGETTGIPSEFEFQLDGHAPLKSKVIWRTRDLVGIQFVGN